jgi:hypothetical protein
MSEASTAAWVVELEEPRFAGVLGAFPHWLRKPAHRSSHATSTSGGLGRLVTSSCRRRRLR